MLEPYRVLDLTDERGELGPMLLGDLGADVIRVESPAGTSARRNHPLADGDSGELASLSFRAFNRNKRSIVLDVDGAPADRDVLRQLIASADFLFESSPPSTLEALGITPAEARTINPLIVHVRISPFGNDGPRAGDLGNDLVVAALGGPMSLQGPRERAPLRISVPQVWRHTGAEAAASALVAHARMRRTGDAQFVDLSAQCVMTWTMLQAMGAHAIQGFDFERDGSRMIGVEIVHACADGHIIALPMSRVIQGLLDWMIADGVLDSSAREADWEAFDQSLRDPTVEAPWSMAEMVALLRAFFARHTKRELFDFGIEHGITLAPVGTMSELLGLEHLAARGYWREFASGDKAPGLWARSGPAAAALLSVRREAPALDADGTEIRESLRSARVRPQPTPEANEGDRLPFAGIKVADFAWVGVGPISSKYLADHGATVVRVESENRPDVLRGGPPFKDNVPGWNRSQFYGDFNTSKLGLALDMKRDEGLAVAKRLIAWADVMVESFAPGAMQRMGLDYAEVRKLNPGIIMVSTCLMGQTGPARAMAGYGYHAAAIAGFYEVTGWPDMAPSGPWTAYTDTIAPRFVSTMIAAALDRKRRTGEGCFIDLAQLEASLHFLAPEILDHQVNGRSVTRIGNRSRFTAPQGAYRCAGEDEWVAIAVESDEQWRALCANVPDLDAGANPANAYRLSAHDE
ncbi:MAG: CoA transferase, partial [Gammaproteobacteria bacterium]|nr:CoA transferase [Gammaproteobacteria bacterium]